MLALVLIGGGILFAFVGVVQPYQQRLQATATAQTQALQATEVARTHAKATAAVLATASAYVEATATAMQELYIQASSGNPTLNDSLYHQNGNKWDVVNNSDEGSCTFKTTPIMPKRFKQIICTRVLLQLPTSPISPIKYR